VAEDHRTDAYRADRREELDAERAKRKRSYTPKHPDPSSFDAETLTTASGERIKVTDREFAIMLERAGGLRTRVAKQLGITSSAVTHRIKRSKYLSEVCRTIDETVLDLAEAQLIKAAKEGEPWAITFILKCKGRSRGWIERQDVAFGGDPEALPPPIVLSVHDAAFIEAERERQRREFAEVVDVAYAELMPQGSADAPGTSGPTGQPSDGGAENGADVAPTEGSSGAESRETGTEAAQGAPCEAEASAQGEDAVAPTGAEIAPVEDGGKGLQNAAESPEPPPPQPQQPRVPRTPSEAAAMRREQEARDRAANGGGHGERNTAQPYRAVPVTFPRRQ
jgi:hypothetical protein